MPSDPTALRPAVFHILLALSQGEMHGLGIAESIAEATGGAVELGPGTLYRSLKEMSRDGLVRKVPPPSKGEDPRRRFYAITARGRELVTEEARHLADVVAFARAQGILPGTQ
jgi:DNA-binding PadR family transcriptional regulator